MFTPHRHPPRQLIISLLVLVAVVVSAYRQFMRGPSRITAADQAAQTSR